MNYEHFDDYLKGVLGWHSPPSLGGLDPSVCVCTTMFRITPHHLLWAVENLVAGKVVNRISVDDRTRKYSKLALDRMLALR